MTSLSRSSLIGALLLLLVGLLLIGSAGCDQAPSPRDAGPDTLSFDSSRPDVVQDAGRACTEDSECDDGVSCTMDSCGINGFCRNQVNPGMCDDGVFCNGVEQCDPRDGCVPGPRETCNDMDVCTIDRCNEAERMCEYFDRDLDEDGDPDFFCGGGDCDDRDPTVSSFLNEVCADAADNDCDGEIDESMCGRPLYDQCDTPLDISAGGFFMIDADGARPDYTFGCNSMVPHDVVATFTISEEQSVLLEARGLEDNAVTLSLRTDCPDRLSEIECDGAGSTATVRERSLAAGTYFVVLGSNAPSQVGITATFAPPIDPPPNDTCAAPIDVSAGGTFMGSFIEVADDTSTSCSFNGSPDVFYTFTTTAPQDVRITATETGGSRLGYSVRTDCATESSEIRCDSGMPASGTLHELPAGTYFIAVEGPSAGEPDFTLMVEFNAPTPAADGDACGNATTIPFNTDVAGTFLDKENDLPLTCGFFGYRDAVYTFDLAAASDVTIELDAGGQANASLRTTCDDAGTELRCTAGNPTRQRLLAVPAGTYFIVVESAAATNYTIRVDVQTPAAVPEAVSGNRNCATAHAVPETGGLYTGSTIGSFDDIGTRLSCGNGANAPDAAFALTLTSSARVVASTATSGFDTVLHIHTGMCVDEEEEHCNNNFGGANTSQIDTVLAGGTTHYIIVDGRAGAAGDYVLDVQVSPP